MEYALTIFKSIFDNKTHRSMRFSNWDKFEELLYALSGQPGYKPKKGEMTQGSALISPAMFKKDDLRRNANVIGWGGWAALDVDDYDTSFEDAIEVFKKNRFVCYSSSSSTKEHPKFRIILPLTKPILADKIRHFWYALNKEFASLGDPQTKDLSRMYYVPAQYPNSYQFIFSHKDAPMIDPDELMSRHAYVSAVNKMGMSNKFPEAIQKKIDEYRKTQLTNTSYRWTSYRDCPFVNRKIVAEYHAIQETGWYAKMYAMMMSIASTAMRKGYPITSNEVALLCREIDNETGGWYRNRPLEVEADRAIEFACRNV